MTSAELLRYCVACLAIVGALWGALAWASGNTRPRVADFVVGALFGAGLGAMSGAFLALLIASLVWFAEWPARW